MLSQSVPPVFDGQTSLDGGWSPDLSAALCQAGGALKLSLKAENQPSFELILSNDLGDQLAVGFDAVEQIYYIDRRNAGLNKFNPEFPIREIAPRISVGRGSDIQIYFDNGSVELFADNGITTMTSLFFPRADYTSAILQTSAEAMNGRLTLARL